MTPPAPDEHARQDRCPGVVALHDAADGRLARVRVPGGRLSSGALRTLAAAAEELGNGLLDITARANLQLRGLRAGDEVGAELADRLHGAGLLRTPMDSGGFMSYGRPGPGRHITIYANSGHMFMVVDGRRFDTSALRVSGSRWTSTSRSTAGYVARHPPGL